MLERAIIEQKIDDYHYKVRIPSFDKSTTAIGSTRQSELYTATLSVPPGVAPTFKSGNVVCVLFESNDLSTPVIVGLLFNDNFSRIQADALFSSLNVEVDTKLSSETTIGKVTSKNIASLENNTRNIAKKFQDIDTFEQDTEDELKTLSGNIHELDEKVDRVDSDLNKKVNDVNTSIRNDMKKHTNNTDIHTSKSEKSKISNHIDDSDIHVTSQQKSDWDNHTHTELTKVKKLTFTTDCYGTVVPSTGVDGQIFFKLEQE